MILIAEPLPALTLYVSLNCPYSALANYRASWLQATMRARVDVRMVCRPGDRSTRTLVGDERRRLETQVAEVRGLLVEGPVFPLRVPSRLPDAREATWRYAHHRTRGTRSRVRRVRLFRGLWLKDDDVSDPQVLTRLGVPGPSAPEPAAVWQAAWDDLDDPIVPLLVTSQGAQLRGNGALAHLLALRVGPSSATSGR